MRIGFGYDVHQMAINRRLVLGGVEIESDVGLLGHSDADVLCHAIADALLGSLALGDIGVHFPDTDERFAGISSLLLLKEVGKMVTQRRHKICNVDSTVVLERPKLMPHIRNMQKNISSSLSISEDLVSVKATTSEKMGFVGRKEGIAVYAVTLLEKIRS